MLFDIMSYHFIASKILAWGVVSYSILSVDVPPPPEKAQVQVASLKDPLWPIGL